MNIEKIFEYKDKLQKDLSFEEISKLYREILYNEYKKVRRSSKNTLLSNINR